MTKWTRLLVAASVAVLPLGPAAGAELVMVEQRGCLYCKMWNDHVGPEEYARTPEGAYAPLRLIDLHAPYPDDLSFASPLRITPTFVLVENGVELARLEGYPGEDFFWGLLGVMLDQHTDFEGGTQ
ncbi:thioredoxin family protein [Palleronia sp. KMU-117]|uniref:thioredoxin family protein n=1 Tax=Palleronia sp. KMU-117 TaxID=3434108 RepID=UPI003D70F8D8